jgi:hypothetical protein
MVPREKWGHGITTGKPNTISKMKVRKVNNQLSEIK